MSGQIIDISYGKFRQRNSMIWKVCHRVTGFFRCSQQQQGAVLGTEQPRTSRSATLIMPLDQTAMCKD